MADVMRSPGPEDPHERIEGGGADSDVDSGTTGASVGGLGRRKKRKGSFWRELPILIGTAFVLTILIQAFVARVFVIPSASMEQTLHGCDGCTNDRILVDKITYLFTDPEPGDVIVFSGPDTWMPGPPTEDDTNPVAEFFIEVGSLLGFPTPNEKDFVKRVIATEGQTVACCDDQNRVTVNGQPLHEPYIYWEPGSPWKQQEFGPVTVPKNHVWVMGDNRNNSADSRVQGGGGVAGAVPVKNIIGKAQWIVLPPSRFGPIPEPNPQTLPAGAVAGGPSRLPTGPEGVALITVLPAAWYSRRMPLASTQRAREYF